MKTAKIMCTLLAVSLLPLTGSALSGTWTQVVQNPDVTFTGIWGNSASDIFVSGIQDSTYGSSAYFMHYDGSVWSTLPDEGNYAGDATWPEAIWGAAPGHAEAAGIMAPLIVAGPSTMTGQAF